jgi:hypothetical protein
MVGQLPKDDQGWATQLANSLLQPSASVVSIAPQSGGLLVTFKVDLYSGDPHPITTDLLVGFKVASATTIQVSALPINGKAGLVSGPLLTFSLPLGTLSTVKPETSCGTADLGIGLKFPVKLGSTNTTTSQTQAAAGGQTLSYAQALAAPVVNSYIELPESSLAQLGSSIGKVAISSSLTAQNIRIGVQGKNLTVTSDVYWHGLEIGVAVSTVSPGAANGKLVMTVTSTSMQILDNLISFPMNSYNQQIQQTLNNDLSGALTGIFNVAQAQIGPNAQLPCAASTSLLLGGTLVQS